ncbi:MAG TPA: hypothetical protein VH396_10655 [Chitinophagaceae bacterium]|jgi:hypothetical protein
MLRLRRIFPIYRDPPAGLVRCITQGTNQDYRIEKYKALKYQQEKKYNDELIQTEKNFLQKQFCRGFFYFQ